MNSSFSLKNMSEESYTKPPEKVPVQIFDTPVDTTKEPKEPEIEKSDLDKKMENPSAQESKVPPIKKSDFEKKMENPFACRICREAFAEPRDLENHVEMHFQESTPAAPGVLEKTEVDPKPDSPPDAPAALEPVAPGVLEKTEVDPKPDSPPIAPAVLETTEDDPKADPPPGAHGVLETTEVDPKADSPEILEPPTQVATLGRGRTQIRPVKLLLGAKYSWGPCHPPR